MQGQAVELLGPSELTIHGVDVGGPEIIEALNLGPSLSDTDREP